MKKVTKQIVDAYKQLDSLVEITPVLDKKNGNIQTHKFIIKFNKLNKSFKINAMLITNKKIVVLSSTNIKSKDRKEEVYIDSQVFTHKGKSIVIDLDYLEVLIKQFILDRVNEIYVNEKEYPLLVIRSSSEHKESRRRHNDNKR